MVKHTYQRSNKAYGSILWLGGTIILYFFSFYAAYFRLKAYLPIGLVIIITYLSVVFIFLRRKGTYAWSALSKFGWISLIFTFYGSQTVENFRNKLASGDVTITQTKDIPLDVVHAQAIGPIAGMLVIVIVLVFCLARRRIDKFSWWPDSKQSGNKQNAISDISADMNKKDRIKQKRKI